MTVQTEDLLLGSVDCELASGLNTGMVGEVERSHACLQQVCKEDIPPLAKVSLPHICAGLEVQ